MTVVYIASNGIYCTSAVVKRFHNIGSLSLWLHLITWCWWLPDSYDIWLLKRRKANTRCSYGGCSYDRVLQEKAAIEAEYDEYRRQVELANDGPVKQEIRMLKTVVKNLEEELTTTRSKNQRIANKRNQQYRQLAQEVSDAIYSKLLNLLWCCLMWLNILWIFFNHF